MESKSYRPVRRADREITEEEASEILKRGKYGVLSTVSGDGTPYGVPLSYIYLDGCVYFHCAKSGHKLDNIRENPQVSFCVVDGVEAFYSGDFTTAYESAVVFGTAVTVESPVEKERVLLGLCEKYVPEHMDKAAASIAAAGARTAVLKIVISHITGKKRARQ